MGTVALRDTKEVRTKVHFHCVPANSSRLVSSCSTHRRISHPESYCYSIVRMSSEPDNHIRADRDLHDDDRAKRARELRRRAGEHKDKAVEAGKVATDVIGGALESAVEMLGGVGSPPLMRRPAYYHSGPSWTASWLLQQM